KISLAPQNVHLDIKVRVLERGCLKHDTDQRNGEGKRRLQDCAESDVSDDLFGLQVGLEPVKLSVHHHKCSPEDMCVRMLSADGSGRIVRCSPLSVRTFFERLPLLDQILQAVLHLPGLVDRCIISGHLLEPLHYPSISLVWKSNHSKNLRSIYRQPFRDFCVDHTGSPLRCTICNDQIIPIRARHCLDCELCVPGFDHHCVWFAQCISITNTLKPFIQVLILGATAILTGAIPIYPIVLQHVRQVIRLTWSAQSSGDTLRKIWWNRWWGWAGGPVYRYIGGLCLGYIYYPEINLQDPSTTFTKAPHGGTKTQQATKLVLSEPTLSALLIVLAATMVLGVILAMLTIVLKNNILNGLSTLEIERARQAKRASREAGVKLWVPSPASDGQPRGKVIFVPPDLPIFDLGPKLNFQHIMGKQVWHWFVPWTIGHLPDGVEWPISDKWIDYLRSLDVYHEGEL
ncbi:hypothetical protein MJO29_011194, partial [Puccinia striiformis f. sp. tritici]